MLKFAKLFPNVRSLEKCELTGTIRVFSAETFKLGYGETHSFRTGIVLEIPEGNIALLTVGHEAGFKGISIAGGLVTAKERTELRVSLSNNHREAYEVSAGMEIAKLVLVDSGDVDVEEIPAHEEE
jgi:dUTPase